MNEDELTYIKTDFIDLLIRNQINSNLLNYIE